MQRLAFLLIVLGCCPSIRAQTDEVPHESGRVKIVIGGDVMLDGGPGHAVIHGEDPFADFAALLRSADVAVCNLECVISESGDQMLKPYTFRGPIQAVGLLKRYFTAVSVANNHTGDFGQEGFVDQLTLLQAAGISAVGGGRNRAEARRAVIVERNGVRVALLAYNGFPPRKFAATDSRPGCAWLNEKEVLEDLRAARSRDQADVVIPLVHWGVEMSPQPESRQRALARRMIDAGATAVIGTHPHVTQTIDVYRGRPIVYSLGNFVFDYFPVDPPQWTGWLAELNCRKSGEVDLVTHALEIDRGGIPHPPAE
jgi:poly-gamma-glutamate capsule biosynthesis protein CapA/YwtB (metallophosphatase superfamily)